MKILAIDTSSKATSVALLEDTKTLIECNLNLNLTHSQTLIPMLKNILDFSNINIKDIDLYAASCGPGSFTGLRIGVAAIKGLAFANNKPCVAVSSLEGLAFNLLDLNSIIVSIIEVRKDKAYTAFFSSKDKVITRLSDDLPITLEEFKFMLQDYPNSYFVGDGAKEWYDLLKNDFTINLPNNNLIFQKAVSIANIGLEKYKDNKYTSAENLELYYGRLPQAQEDLLRKGK